MHENTGHCYGIDRCRRVLALCDLVRDCFVKARRVFVASCCHQHGRRDRPASSHLYVSRRWYCSRCRRNLRLLSMRPDRADTPMSASTTPTLTNTSRKLCLSASAVFRGGHQNQTRLCGVWPRLPSARATCRRYMETLDQVPTTRSCCPVALQQTWPSRPRRLEATHQGSEPRRRRPRGIVATSTTGRIS